MANLKSAKKAIRQAKRRTERNQKIKRAMKEQIKEMRELIEGGKLDEAQEKMSVTMKKIDKAAKSNVIHKNTAARYKSRLAKRLNKSKK